LIPGGFRRGGKKGGGRRQSWLRRTFGMDRMFELALLAGLLVFYAADPYIIEVIRVKTFDMYQTAYAHGSGCEIRPPDIAVEARVLNG